MLCFLENSLEHHGFSVNSVQFMVFWSRCEPTNFCCPRVNGCRRMRNFVKTTHRVRDDVDHSLSTVGPVCRSAELPDRMGLSTNESPISRCVWWWRRCLCCPLVASVRPLLALDGPPQPPLLSWPAVVVVGVTVIRARQLTQHCNTAEELVRRWICQRHRGCYYTDCNCSDTMIARYVDRVISRMSLKSVRRDSRNNWCHFLIRVSQSHVRHEDRHVPVVSVSL